MSTMRALGNIENIVYIVEKIVVKIFFFFLREHAANVIDF